MKNRAFRKFVASIGVAAMVMSTATNAMSPAVTRAESAQELEGQQNDSQEQGGQENPVAQSSDDTNGAPFADAEPMAVSPEDSQDSQEAAGPSESSDSNGENGTEGSSGENTNASVGSTSTDASGAESQGATDTSANGTSTDASTGTTTGENGEASGDNAEASTKEITSVITEDIDLGTYPAGEAPAYAQLELPDEIEVKVDEEKQTVTVTWNGEETYHPDQAGTYIFSSELDKEWNKDENGNARYQLAEKVELPKAYVRVEKKAESTEDSKAEVKSDNKTENKTDAKLDIKEDNKTDAKADNKSEDKTEEKSDNKSEVTTKPETTKETTKDTSKENTKETSKKDSASKDKTKDETKNETKGEAKNEAKEENKTDTKDETAKADQKKKVTNAASLKAVYVAEDGTVLCGTVGLTGDSFTISDKAKSFNGYELKTVTLGEEELPQDTVFTRNTSTTETKEEIRTEASYTYSMDGAEHEIAAGDTATITFTYAQKEEVTPEIASIEVTGEAVDTTGAAIQGDYAFPLAVGTNDLSKTAPYIQGYEYQYAEIGTDKITSIAKEVLEAGKYAYYVDGELLKENTKITYVYQEDEDYTEQLSADCGDVSVTLSAKKDARIPKNAKLVVNAITGDRLRSALSMSAEAMGVTADKVYGTAYDIYLEADGNRIQPSEHVHVTMSFHNPVSLNLPDKAQVAKSAVIHIHDGSASEVSGTAETDGSSVTGAEFDADSFSIYVNAYTVDFHYNGLTYSMKGNGAVKLSKVMKAVDIQEDVAEVKSAVFTNPELLKVEKDTEGNDWTLTSLQSFTSDELLTVTMEDGTVYAIAVTDPEEGTSSIVEYKTELREFLDKVEFKNAETTQDGVLQLYPGREYSFNLSFSEKSPKLFKRTGELVYQFPHQLTPTGNTSGTFDIDLTIGNKTETIGGNSFEIKGDKLIIHLNQSKEAQEKYNQVSNIRMNFSFSATLKENESKGEFDFSDTQKIKYEPAKGKLKVEKTGDFDRENGRMNYTVTVTSTGDNTEIEVSDEINGTLLHYANDLRVNRQDKNWQSTQINNGQVESDDKGFSWKSADGFTLHDGEKLIFTYSAKVDFSNFKGKEFTVEQTNNKVTAKSKENPDEQTDEKNFEHTTVYNAIKKELSGELIQSANGTQQATWKITVNENPVISIGGAQITDTIQNNVNAPMSYSGEGLTVTKKNKNGDVVSTSKVLWNDSSIKKDGGSFTYTIPKEDTEPYSYEISYTTEIDASNIYSGDDEKITNTVKDGKGTTASPQVSVKPTRNFEVKKNGVKDENKIDYTVEITVPKNGISREFTIIDTLPAAWANDKYVGDVYNEGTLQIWVNSQIVDKGKYLFNPSDIDKGNTKPASLNITFKTEYLSKLFPESESDYTVKLSYSTSPDKSFTTHENTVSVTLDGKTRNDSDTIYFYEKTLTKENGKDNFEEEGLPVYSYTLHLTGVDTDTIKIEDAISVNNKEDLAGCFEYYYVVQNQYNQEKGTYVVGSESPYYIFNGTYAIFREKEAIQYQNGELSIKVPKKEDGSYFSNYYIHYYVKVKDEESLKKLKEAALENRGTAYIYNQACWGEEKREYTYNYAYKPISKKVDFWPTKDNKYQVTYKIIINQDKLQLNGGNDITLSDKMSETLALLPSSVQIRVDDSSNVSNGTEYGLDYPAQMHEFTLKLPDGHKYEITYAAQVLGGKDAAVEYQNSATINGIYTADTNKESVEKKYDGSGDGSAFAYTLLKRSELDHQRLIPGAVFLLEEKNGDNYQTLCRLTTDENGKSIIHGSIQINNWKITEGNTYRLTEISAPDGFLLAKPIEFVAGEGNYFNGAEIIVEDTPGVSVKLEGTKSLKGRGLKDQEFSFNLKGTSDNAKEVDQTVTNDQDGKITFPALEYTKAGTYVYEVTEKAGTENGITYDKTKYHVTVVVADNKEGKLTVTSQEVKKGEETVSGISFKNEYAPAKTNITLEGTKSLKGRELKDQEFSFNLKGTSDNAKEVDQTVTNDQDGKITFPALEYTKAGTYVYEVTEKAGTETGITYDQTVYHVTVEVTDDKVGHLQAKVNCEGSTGTMNLIFTNHYDVVNVSVSKSWSDDNNRDNKRPDSIEVKLVAKVDGSEIAGLSSGTQKLNGENGWKYTFTDLPKYHAGKPVEYTVEEVNIPAGYTKTITGNATDGFNITNTYTPEKVQVSGLKNWNDDGNAAGTRPGSITIRLYANGSEIDHKTVTEKDGWSWNWTGLNRYDTDHKEISYTISEDAVDGYTSSISGYNVTNTVNKPQVGSVILTKVDATTGTALAGAVFDLYRANNTKVGTYTTNAGGVLRVDGLTFGDYYFVETKAPEGYALESQRAAFTINAATTVSAPASVRVTNKPVDEKIGVSAAKVWDDENNTDGVRPSSVTFRLFADGVEIGSAQASEANGWTVSFGNLPKTRNGAVISYAVKEDEVGNYYEASYETGLGSDGSYVFTVKNYRETDKHYEERTGSVRGANRNKPSNGGVAGRGRGTGDESDMTVYGTVSGASLLALIVWMIARRKRAGKGTK